MNEQPLWSASEAEAATGGEATSTWQARGLSIDSRSCAAGDLFIALSGPNFDGHAFIADALNRGAVAAIAAYRPECLSEDAPLLLVEDTMRALEALGRASRARSTAKIAAITGSSGKTSTKEALAHCLAPQDETFCSRGSFNNHWGVPLSLGRMPRSTAYGVFELGMNHPGEILELTRQVRPHVAVITNIGLAHIEFFKDQSGIADAKAEIFQGLEPGGAAILPRDDPFFSHLADRAEAAGAARLVSYGADPDAAVRLVDSSLYAACSAVTARIGGEELDFCLSLPGKHWVMNALAVLAAVKALGADPVVAARQFASLEPMAGRGKRIKAELAGGRFDLIDDAYNANPASMRAAFDVLSRAKVSKGGRRIAVLGDMLEMGDQAEAYHAALAQPIQDTGIDLVFTCGHAMAALHDALPAERRGTHRPTSEALLPEVLAAIRPGDCVLVKGSLGSRMRVVVEGLQAPPEAPALAANGG